MTKAARPQTAVLFIDSILADFDSFTRNAYKDVQPDKAYQHYAPLLDGLLSSNINAVPVFTTNYDLVFESMRDCDSCGWYIETGMKQTGMRVVLDTKLYDRVESTRPRILVYKLHGSTDWWVDKESGQIRQIPLDHKAPDTCRELMIYPTREKFEQTKEKPFSFFYERLKADLSSKVIRVCIAIGYSFRDKVINEMFVESLKNGLKLVVFDKSMKQKQLLSEFSIEESNSIVNNIHIYGIDFGNWRRPTDRNIFTQILNDEIRVNT